MAVCSPVLAQVKAGGPVTITHPEMRRYFMLIPEAVHSSCTRRRWRGAETSSCSTWRAGQDHRPGAERHPALGLIPEDEIALKFVGLRPGEKLEEELVGSDEVAMSTSLDRILHVAPRLSLEATGSPRKSSRSSGWPKPGTSRPCSRSSVSSCRRIGRRAERSLRLRCRSRRRGAGRGSDERQSRRLAGRRPRKPRRHRGPGRSRNRAASHGRRRARDRDGRAEGASR